MKTVLTIAALVFISGAVMATGNLKVNIIPGEKDEAMIHITNAAQSKYEIEVKNENGDIVFYKQTQSPSATYSKSYNFSMLEDGEYDFAVKVGSEKEVNTLKIYSGKVKVAKQEKEVAPYFIIKADRLELSYLNFGNETSIIKIIIQENDYNFMRVLTW